MGWMWKVNGENFLISVRLAKMESMALLRAYVENKGKNSLKLMSVSL